MIKMITTRVLQALPLLIIISFFVFLLIHFAPFDAVDSITKPNMSETTVNALKARYGLDQPFFTQYVLWIKNIFEGNFGHSIVTQRDIGTQLAIRIPRTISIVLPAYLISMLLAIVLGMKAGTNQGKWIDKLIDSVSAIGLATPSFWVAMLLIYFVGYRLNLLPIFGMHTLGMEHSMVDYIKHAIMPVMVLTFVYFPDQARYVRSSTISQLSYDYVQVQKAFGATQRELMYHHVLKNVLMPIVTQVGISLPMLITGAIITESVFSWPGVGPYLINATSGLDYPVVMAVMLISAFLVIVGNLLSDILYMLVDPRIRQDIG